jgi:CheY-like chemotaxis protein
VVNLLSNAVKFTTDGVVVMTARRDPADPDLLCISVRDSGIGFPPEVAERLFVRFEQADGSVTRRFGGTGLGLAISRDLVERMGGRIWAQGEPGRGATFHVEVPMAALDGLDPAVQGPAWVSAEAMSRPLRVLCAEDHPVNRKVVEFILEAAGVALVCAVDGQEAVDLFRTDRFDAILMDMQMPVMDGLSATRAIRRIEAEEGLRRTPVLMLTANAMPEHLASSQAAGADGHLTKPIAADKLMSMLETVTAEVLLAEAEAA